MSGRRLSFVSIVLSAAVVALLLHAHLVAQAVPPRPNVAITNVPGLSHNVLAADFNADGVTDLLGGDVDGGMLLALGIGDGTFAAASLLLVDDRAGSSPLRPLALLDQRASIDILAVTQVTSTDPYPDIYVFSINRSGTFRGPILIAQDAADGEIVDAVTGDFDADGDADFATLESSALRVYTGAGEFGLYAPPLVLPTYSEAHSVIAGDFDANGKLDFAVTTRSPSSISLFMQRDNREFGFTPKPPIVLEHGALGIAVVNRDAGRDNAVDLIVSAADRAGIHEPWLNGFVYVLKGNGDGTFQPPIEFPTTIGPVAVVTGDFNRDGRADVATTHRSYAVQCDTSKHVWDGVSVLPNLGHGKFGAAVTFELSNSEELSETAFTGDQHHMLATSDLNADGSADLIASPGAILLSVPPVANRAPIANAGPPTTIPAGEQQFSLNGSATDPDMDWLTFTWTDEAGRVVGTVPRPCIGIPSAEIQTYTLKVSDGHGGEAIHTVMYSFDSHGPSTLLPVAIGVGSVAAAGSISFDSSAYAMTSPMETKLPGGLALTPPMGWNTWNTFGCDINEQLIRDMADRVVSSGMDEAGYEYINIDDCWMAYDRDSEGNLQPDPARFPSGIAAIADYVHLRGLKLGIYSSAGTLTCQGRPASIGHEAQDAARFAEWGVDFLKYDNCGDHLGLTAIERYTRMRDALLATGRPIVFSLCNWGQEEVHEWGSDVGHLWRTTDDILANWDRVMWILDQQVGLETYSGPGGWNDPDMLETGNPGLTSDESRAHFSLWALLNAPLITSNDLRSMSAETEAVLTDSDVIAVNQDWAGIQGHRIRDDGEQEIWYKPMSDNTAAVVLLNRSSSSASMAITASEIGLPPALQYDVKDLWTDEVRSVQDRYETTVPGHAAVMVRVSITNNDGAINMSGLVSTSESNGWGPVERNRSNGEYAAGDGAQLTLNGTPYANGLGVHAYSDVRYALTGQCSTFEAVVGIDDEVGALGSVVFRVFVDGIERYTSGVMTGSTASATVLVNLVGASELALVVTDGGDGPFFDHADWVAAHVHCDATSPLYLSDRSSISTINGWGPVEPDRSNGELGANDGGTLTLEGVSYAKGLGVHAYSDVRYALTGQCSTFEAVVGIDDEVGALGSVVFRVFVDGIERYTSGVMTGSTASATVLVNLVGASELALVVTDGGDGPSFDHADWANAHVHCNTAASSYLSDHSWISTINGWGPVERDRSNGELGANDGRTLTLEGLSYAKGLGVHAYSDVRYALNGACSALATIVGVDDEVGDNGSVTFQVWTDGTLRYDSGVRGVEPRPEVYWST